MGIEVVDIRVIVGQGTLKAFADVKFMIPGTTDIDEGSVTAKGFCVMQGKTGVFVSAPRKASKDGRWFDVLEFSENVKKDIETKVLAAYEREK